MTSAAPDRKERIQEYRRRYYRKHKERVDARNKQWRAKNRDKHRASTRAYVEKNRPAVLQYMKTWRENNRDRKKALSALSERRIKADVFTSLGNKCKRCGFEDVRALQVDHINRAHEKRGSSVRSGKGLYAAIRRGDKSLSEFQLLCANCNWIKRHENAEHN